MLASLRSYLILFCKSAPYISASNRAFFIQLFFYHLYFYVSSGSKEETFPTILFQGLYIFLAVDTATATSFSTGEFSTEASV